MIRIHKPKKPPAILRTRGQQAAQALRAAFDAAPQEHRTGDLKFEFNSTLYGAKSVKTALRKAQHEKCAFSESLFVHVAYGDVEYFRPKAGFAQQEGDALGRPGYYWLAYEWNNLYFSCQLCNQRFKRNLFPLKNPANRALSHLDANVGIEEPLLIDAGLIEPGEYLGFRKEEVYAINGNAIGETTINVLGLDREELVEQRRKHLLLIKDLHELRQLFTQRQAKDGLSSKEQTALRKLEKRLEGYTRDTAPYAAMARAALR